MTSDGLEGVAITYNCIDLPANVSSAGTTKANYYYLADGTATSVQKADKSGLVFRGPFTYRRSSAGALTLESAECEEGRLTTSGAMLHVTDHLGSVVAVVRGSDGVLYEASDYDAYGKRSSLTNAGTVSMPSGITQRDRFTGKEDQGPDFAVGYTDFGARHYSPSLRRWLVPDPLSEKYYGIIPYAYCAGDPVNRVDTDGKIWDTVWDIANVVMDVKSLAASISEGNVGRAIVDGVSTVADIAAAAVPFIPGGAGATVKAARGVDKAVDVAKTPGYVVDAAKAVDSSITIKTYQTYTKTNPITGEVYIGRTSGFGTPLENIRKRDANHHMNDKGFGPAVLDKSSSEYNAIRGREQIMIDNNGGAKSSGGTSGNLINEISINNPKRDIYFEAGSKLK